jgi:hypothetical protein
LTTGHTGEEPRKLRHLLLPALSLREKAMKTRCLLASAMAGELRKHSWVRMLPIIFIHPKTSLFAYKISYSSLPHLDTDSKGTEKNRALVSRKKGFNLRKGGIFRRRGNL